MKNERDQGRERISIARSNHLRAQFGELFRDSWTDELRYALENSNRVNEVLSDQELVAEVAGELADLEDAALGSIDFTFAEVRPISALPLPNNVKIICENRAFWGIRENLPPRIVNSYARDIVVNAYEGRGLPYTIPHLGVMRMRTQEEMAAMRGVGPVAMAAIQEVLSSRGLAFASGAQST